MLNKSKFTSGSVQKRTRLVYRMPILRIKSIGCEIRVVNKYVYVIDGSDRVRNRVNNRVL